MRLGIWLPNPKYANWRGQLHPAHSILPFLKEVFGRETDDDPYIYLSDGGHFENLGLYEMVKRRCRIIVVVDASSDPDFSLGDLANAVEKIRVDLGISITLPRIMIFSPFQRRRDIPKYCSIGNIRYSRLDPAMADGILVYLKASLTGDEPLEVVNYAEGNPEFPHESTRDQWFIEAQFESYRLLGSHIVEEICGRDWRENMRTHFKEYVGRGQSELDFFVNQVKRYLSNSPDDVKFVSPTRPQSDQ